MLDRGRDSNDSVRLHRLFVLGDQLYWSIPAERRGIHLSRNHAPVNVGISMPIASMFGTWVLLSPGETGANFGIISLVSYAIGMGGMGVSRNTLMFQARAAIAVPMLVVLLSTRMPGWGVLLAGYFGIVVRALIYPRPGLVSPMLATAPACGQMLWSFTLALVVSSAITAMVILFREVIAGAEGYDLSSLKSGVQLIDEPVARYD